MMIDRLTVLKTVLNRSAVATTATVGDISILLFLDGDGVGSAVVQGFVETLHVRSGRRIVHMRVQPDDLGIHVDDPGADQRFWNTLQQPLGNECVPKGVEMTSQV